MKKKLIKSLVLAAGMSIVMAGSAMALPFSSTGVVNQNFNNSWNETNNTGTASFSFYIDNAFTDVKVSALSLELESDIFDLNSISASNFTVKNPTTGWNTMFVPGSNGYEFSISYDASRTNPVMTTNDPLVVEFEYTLLDSAMYNNDSEGVANGWGWDEGQAWGLAYTLYGTDSSTYGIPCIMDAGEATSSGSTAPVPEPATMLLFGAGLVGLAGFSRRKNLQK